MAEETIAIADGIEAAQARICEVRAIMQLAVENMEHIPAASDATHAVHIASEMLDGLYEQLESLLEPEQMHYEVLRRPAANEEMSALRARE
jgi:hypothetical protein